MTRSATHPAGTAAVDWRVRLLLPVGMMLIRLLASTWRITERNGEVWRQRNAAHQPWILSLWHGTLLVVAYRHRGQNQVAVVSEHRDGELIARVLHAWGYRTIRGSSTRGGGRALLAMIREMGNGSVITITPDGPRGPSKVFQPGALVAANRAGVPIVAMGVHADRVWRLKSWDSFMIPKPFAKVCVAYEGPETVAVASSREAAALGGHFADLMQAAERRAHA